MQPLTLMRKSIVLALPLLALAGAFLRTGGTAQQTASTPAAAPKPATHDVTLPVTVRDKKGALVNDLQKNDLTLSEDGRPQTIKSFSRDTNLPLRVGLLVD